MRERRAAQGLATGQSGPCDTFIPQENVMPTPELLTCQEVLHLTGIRSRTTIWRRIQTGGFPSPVDLGAGRIRWRASDIAEWISALPLRRY